MMRHYPSRLDIILAIIVTLSTLSWMGADQISDEKKTAEVKSSIDAQQKERLRQQLAKLERQGKTMTSYDKVASK